MADRESRSSMMSQSYADLTTPWRTGMKEMVARYVDTSEKLAKGALDFQERATTWAKGTPWASLFETQHTMASRFVESWASLTRKLWDIEKEEHAHRRTERAEG